MAIKMSQRNVLKGINKIRRIFRAKRTTKTTTITLMKVGKSKLIFLNPVLR